MTWPQHQDPNEGRKAKAPYNFVPLPERVKWANDLPSLDAYHPERYTGWLDCTLTTSSPLYIRAGLTAEQARKGAEAKDRPDFFYTDPHTQEPVIPGSSLRGMLRNLIEIISYSKVQPVTDKHKFTFRAVAAPREDPLSQPYQDALGKYGRNVKAGYLVRRGERWYVKPAQCPKSLGLPEKGAYLKVKDRQIPNGAIPGFIRFSSSRYHPQYHAVSFETETRHGESGEYVAITEIGADDAGYRFHGVLVCSGNMAETGGGKSKRKNYALVLERNPKAKEIPIDEQTIEDYLDSLTEFQKQSPPFSERMGCLKEGRPVFYIEKKGRVIAFGHTPNFRVPAWLPDSHPKRAATPLDFVPYALRDPTQTDLAEGLFGYVEPEKQDTRPVARAGRIFVTDATLSPGQKNFWLSDIPITPRVLASPKPTTFQHYLVQTAPNNKRNLHHYGSSTPNETVIRGHKLYWHKGNMQQSDFEEPDLSKWDDSQYTKIKPLCSGVRFHFRIYFEDLDAVELGALLWLLDVAADEQYRLKLGMGKPLGLGAVEVEASLHLTDREARYMALFTESGWAIGKRSDADAVYQNSVQAFERWVLDDRVLNPNRVTKLADVPRIQMLLFLLSWPGPDREQTRYLEIEHPQNDNEYKNRPVLPTPQRVMGITSSRSSSPLPSPRPHAPHKLQTVKHPTTADDIQPDDLLEGKIIAVEPNRVLVDLGVAKGSMGLVKLDEVIRQDPWFKDFYGKIPTAEQLYAQDELEDIFLNTSMQVLVRRVEHSAGGKLKIKLTPVKWLEQD